MPDGLGFDEGADFVNALELVRGPVDRVLGVEELEALHAVGPGFEPRTSVRTTLRGRRGEAGAWWLRLNVPGVESRYRGSLLNRTERGERGKRLGTADLAKARRRSGGKVDGVEGGPLRLLVSFGDDQAGEGGSGADCDIEACDPGDIHPQGAHRIECAGIRRILDDQHVARGVDVVEGGASGRVVVAVGVGGGTHRGNAAKAGIRSGVGQARIHRGDGSRVGIGPEILAAIADDADAVHDRIEVEREVLASEESRERSTADRGGLAALPVDLVKPA